jgi:CO dehydrogenase maturation factor
MRDLPARGGSGPGLRVAFAGKGGAGKSVIAATVARLLARRGRRVLALDSDMLPGLALSLGASVPEDPPLAQAAEKDADGRWRLRKGIGPVRAVRRYSTEAPDGVRLLQAGKSSSLGLSPVMGAITAFHAVIHRLPEAGGLAGWDVVGDLPGGPRQPAFDWAPYAERLLLVVEPTSQSMLTARRIARISAARGSTPVSLVVNKVAEADDVRRVEQFLRISAWAAIPADEEVRAAERVGVALLDGRPDAPAVLAIEQLVDRLLEDPYASSKVSKR